MRLLKCAAGRHPLHQFPSRVCTFRGRIGSLQGLWEFGFHHRCGWATIRVAPPCFRLSRNQDANKLLRTRRVSQGSVRGKVPQRERYRNKRD